MSEAGARAFGIEVRERRERFHYTRARLARDAHLSESGLKNIESGIGGQWRQPRRATVIDLAAALDWDVDDALALAGHEPVTDQERSRLASPRRPSDRGREMLDRLWPSLTVAQRQALIHVAAAMADPAGGADDVVVYQFAPSVQPPARG